MIQAVFLLFCVINGENTNIDDTPMKISIVFNIR